jgi:hypothetical protein
MSGISADEYKKRTELLKTARQLLTQEYIAKRTDTHKQWIANSETSWRTNGALLPYPSGSLYPTEGEVVAKALELYNNSLGLVTVQSSPIIDSLPETPPAPTATFSTTPITDITQQLQEVYFKPEISAPPVVEIPVSSPWAEYLTPTPTPLVSPEPDSMVEPEPVPEVAAEPEPEVIPEEILTAVAPEIAALEPTTELQTTQPKHSLLRNVLSSWLQKNKDNPS